MRTPAPCRAALGVLVGAALAIGPVTGGSVARVGAAIRPVPPGAPAATGLLTPVLSVRRVPDWIEAATTDRRFAARLPKLMARLGSATTSSCLLVTQAGRTIFAQHATREELPASNLKLLTATAILDRLGASLRLRTSVTERGRIVGGVLHGDLYLVGGGDPFLRTPGYQADLDYPEPVTTSLPQLARRVKAAGIRAIRGDVVGDEHLFDARRGVATWEPIYRAEEDVGPLSALDVNDGFSPTKPFRAANRPAVMAASVFAGLLRKDGVRVGTDHTTAGVSPRSARPVTSIASPPMSTMIDTVLRISDDTGAEMLTKVLGRRVAGAGTTAAGTRAVRVDLAHDGLPVAELRNLDSSGLDRGDRASCALLVADLEREGTHGPLFAGLPVAGKTGTLTTRMIGTKAQGRLHAKTGTLDGVSALSGFVMAAPGTRASTPEQRAPIVFSFISNDLPGSYLGAEVGDAIGAYLAAEPAAPPIFDAVPRRAGP